MKSLGQFILQIGAIGLIAGTGVPFGASVSQAADPAPQSTGAPASSSNAKFDSMCPEEVRTKQTAATPVKGWSSFVEVMNARQIFTGAALYEGHPKDGVVLDAKPSPVDSPSNETFYDLPKGKEVYLVCQYGNTLVRLFQKLPKDLLTCRIRYSETLGHVQKAVCD